MEDKPLSRGEHEEFRQTVLAKFETIAAEDYRQNVRIDKLEAVTDQINELAISVHELAQSVRTMSQTQAKEGSRLEALEERDGQKWRDALKAKLATWKTAKTSIKEILSAQEEEE